MAGLGAYGGAGLAGGLMGAGASAMNGQAANAMQAANPEITANEIGREMGTKGFVQPEIAANMNPVTATAADKLSLGASNMGSTAGRNAFMQQMGGGMGLAKTGLAAAAPMMMGDNQQPQTPVGDSTMPQRLQYNVGRATDAQGKPFTPAPDVPGYGDLGRDFGRPQSYFPNAGYQQITQEEAKKLRGYAGGGPVEAMSNANAIGANTGYPMANVNKATYATPYQTPVAQNVVQGSADTGVNSMTGEMNEFANGGITGSGNLDLSIPLNLGGGAGGANGYQAAGSGGNQQRQNSLGITQPQGGGLGQFGQGFGGMRAPFVQTGENINGGAPRQAQAGASAAGISQLRSLFGGGLGAYNFGLYGGQPTSAAQGPESRMALLANGGLSAASGGMSHLGDYSDGGRLLKGPGDGVSDSIPATIGKKQPARLADGEFVVPARIVSELGNGSTEAGARKLYAMLDRVQAARKKSIGKGKVANNSRADKLLPA